MNRKIVIVLFSVPLIIFSIYKAEGVHLPLLLATITAIGIGFIEPKKGWLLALVQAITLAIGGYYSLTLLMEDTEISELQIQCLIGVVGITFVGSFIGAFIKRALDE